MQKTTPSGRWIGGGVGAGGGGIADLPLLRTLFAIHQKSLRAKFLRSGKLFCFINICKFGSFKNVFATVTSLSELYVRFRRIILLVQTKKMISMNYGSSTSSWKRWRWYFQWGIYTSILTLTHSQNSLAAAEAGLWESQSGIRVGKLMTWMKSEFTRSISFTRIGKPVPMMEVKVSKGKHISRWVDRENLIYVRWNRIKNCTTTKKVMIKEKEVRHWVK